MQGRIVLILVVLGLAACATPQWHRADTSPEQLALDTQACELEVRQRFPTSPQLPKPLAYDTDCSTYGHQANCAAGPGPIMSTPSRMSQKKTALQECLAARGYSRR
jgi:hypothetical protein